MRITIAQFQVNRNMASNEARILSVLRAAQPNDLIVFPEGAPTGYFPDEDWFPHSIDPDALDGAIRRACSEAARLNVNCILGAATSFEGVSRNSAIMQTGQGRPGLYHKRQLGRPELSLFEPGTTLPVSARIDPQETIADLNARPDF